MTKITFDEAKAVLDTLPINYYSKFSIDTELDSTSSTSYYDMAANKIVVAYNNFKNINVFNTLDKESIIRGLLYHEVSHAILTPNDLVNFDDIKSSCAIDDDEFTFDYINIFEDERIETILHDYYLNVNFKKNLFRLNEYSGEDPKTVADAFFQAVRFRAPIFGHNLNEKVNYIITYSTSVKSSMYLRGYVKSIYDLYLTIKSIFDAEIKKRLSSKSNSSSNNINKDNSNKKEDANGNDKQNEEIEDEQNNGNADYNINSESSKDNVNQNLEDTDNTNYEDNLNDLEQLLIERFENSLSNCLNHDYAKSLIETSFKAAQSIIENKDLIISKLEPIVATFNKKNSGGGSVSSYSGMFNYRNAGRSDYRYFSRSSVQKTANSFGSLHLNLFVDDSGSMCDNEPIINGLIAAMKYLSNKYQFFSYDFITCANKIKRFNARDEYIANGRTYLSESIIPLYEKVQKHDLVYNIVMFDGSAQFDSFFNGQYYPHYGRRLTKKQKTTFSIFNNSKSILILDPSNDNIAKTLSGAREVIISSNYTTDLIRNIEKTFSIVSREN